MTWLTEARRNRIYLILTALVPLLISYGVVNQAQAALWLALASAVLGTGMAAVYTTKAYGKHAKAE